MEVWLDELTTMAPYLYLFGLCIVLVEKGLDPVSIIWMDSLQVLNLHEEARQSNLKQHYVEILC